MSKEKKPEIRFKGNQGSWNEKILNSFVERVTRKNTENNQLVLTASALYGLIDQQSFFNKKIAGSNLLNYYLIKKGEFAYNKSYSSKYPWGAVKRLDKFEKGVLSTLYIVFNIIRKDIDSDFLTIFFETDRWHEYLSLTAEEGARNHGLLNISIEQFFSLPLTIPSNILEQKLIGRLFIEIGNLILEQDNEIKRLEILKQASLYKMFPRPGSSVPEIRFKGFTEPWIKTTIKNLFSEGNSRGEFENLLSVSIGDGVYPTTDFIKTNTVTDFSNYKTVYVNDIVYNSMRMWQGASGVSFWNGIVSPAYTVLRPNEKIYSPFMAYYFKIPWVVKMFELNSQGLTKDTWNLKYPAISQLEFYVPKDIEEQKLISEYFDRLSSVIKIKKQKLAKLRQIKEALLEKMFVNID